MKSLAEKVVDQMYDNDWFSQWLGIERVEISAGRSVLKLTIRKEMLNGFAIAHGGITYSLADSALAFASNSYGIKSLSIETSINHVQSCKEGDEITAVAEELNHSEKLAHYLIKVTNHRNEIVAIFKGMVYRTSKEWFPEKREIMKDAFIVNGVRTAIGNLGGALASVRTDDLAAFVLAELLKKNPSVDPAEIADVILGCANQAGEDNRNVARMALLLAGLPISVPGETVNRLCASGMSASIHASRMIQTGDADLVIGGGVENMTRGPWVISKTSTPYGRDAQMYDSSFGWRFVNPKMKEKFGTDSMGETAENLVLRDKISREDQDKFSLWSQQKATAAQKRGRFSKEIAPVSIPQKKGEAMLFKDDEFIKPGTTTDILAKLKPAFKKDGSVTAGNSSGLNDSAAALLLASEDGINKYGLKRLARIVSSAVVGVEPSIMGIGPVEASNRAIKKAGLSWKDIDIIELNEAFAAQSLACTRAWGLADNDPRINPNGGAIALGHPLGMSGARILLSAAIELNEQNKKFALVTMCIGVGQGFAVVIERAN